MINCPICSTEFNEFTNGKPKTYCSDDCKDYYKYKNALERILIKIKPHINDSKLIRGDMFRMANLIPNGTNSLRKDNRQC